MDDCIFCKIIRGEIPSQVVYEDDKVLAFNDIHAEAPVHILIVPKEHIKNVAEINDTNIHTIGHIHKAAIEIARITGVDRSGYRLVTNCGKDAGQTIFHLHYHLLGGRDLGPKLI